MSDIAYISTHTADALLRLIDQYKDKPRMAAFVSAFTDRVQDIEDALYLTFFESAIADAVGAQLDVLGDVVGQKRQGMVDDEYRSFIYARIKVNRSDGKLEQLLEILSLILNGQDTPPTDPIEATEMYPCTVLLEAYGVTANPFITWRDFLEPAAAGGVRLFYVSNQEAIADSLIAADENGDFVPEEDQTCSDENGDFDGGLTSCAFG